MSAASKSVDKCSSSCRRFGHGDAGCCTQSVCEGNSIGTLSTGGTHAKQAPEAAEPPLGVLGLFRRSHRCFSTVPYSEDDDYSYRVYTKSLIYNQLLSTRTSPISTTHSRSCCRSFVHLPKKSWARQRELRQCQLSHWRSQPDSRSPSR